MDMALASYIFFFSHLLSYNNKEVIIKMLNGIVIMAISF
jgi:hypothetical protein